MNFVEYSKKRDLEKTLIDKFGKYRVYSVDGEKIRAMNISRHEFTDYALHTYWPKLIPKNEIWIDDVTKHPNDLSIIITQALQEYKLIDSGDKDAYDKALKHAKKLREIIDGLPFHPEKTDEPAPKEVYVSKYGVINEGSERMTVWLVDGEIVRDEFKTDYVEGGNGFAFSWLPLKEIWIEDTLHDHEIPLIILHEFVERELMKYKHFSYNKAHTIASKIEFEHEGKFNKKDALGLNKEEALEMASKFE